MPLFANPAGLWLLAGLPVILAIHFLQQRAQVVRTSTWFLIENLAPDSARGRTWDRLRSSRTLWCQLAALTLGAWVLAEPRWVRPESAQTVVLVLDASVSMDAFRGPAIAAAEREMQLADGLAARTHWVIMTTDPREPALYRGEDRIAARAACERWQPQLGHHDLAPALRLARGLAGAAGRTLLITDQRAKVPPDQRAAGVGQPIDNVGFAGATIMQEDTGVTWRALVKNHGAARQQRTWHFEAAGIRSPAQSLSLAPGALTEISARLPEGVERGMVVLAGDGFAVDDRLPLVRPQPKPISVEIDGTDDAAQFFQRLAADVSGIRIVPAGGGAQLRLARAPPEEVAREPRGGIFWPPADQRAQVPLMAEPVTPERDPLVAGLNWQGWIGTGPHGYAAAPGDRVLLWQGRWPLVLLRAAPGTANRAANPPPPASARKLLLAFDWATSNAPRLPGAVLLARRFLEAERDAQRAPYAANFDTGGSVAIAGLSLELIGAGAETVRLSFHPARGGNDEVRVVPPAELPHLRTPGRPGFFELARGEELLVRGAAQFADARQGDFRGAARFFVELRRERTAAIERNTRADPFAIVWLLLAAGFALGSWWMRPRAVGMAAEPISAAEARAPS